MHSDDTRKATDLGEELFDGIESTREFWCRFLLCVNIIENLTNRHPLKLSQRSCMLSTIQNDMWHRVLRVSTVRLGGEGRKFFELQTFAIDLSDLRIWKKLRIANQLKILARFSDFIYPEVSFSSWIVNFRSVLVTLYRCFVDQFFLFHLFLGVITTNFC